jgi:protein-L-isoaspartate(D-aspartate) O-methyltransferase
MDPRDAAWTSQPDTSEPTSADAARARLVTELRHRGGSLSPSVQDAFAQVPRHVFVPEVGPAAAYRDEAFVIKCGPDGMPVSSSSQPAMMAIMLDQLDLRPGHRVLEIGTGSGYNAAVMAAVVGPGGEVVTIDIDADLVARARSSLLAAGYDAVTTECGDGGYGDPANAPFDRIIVTAGAWDIAPAWLDQLAPGGRLVLPLSVRGIQLSVALERVGKHWMSTSAWRCGFVRMLGAYAGPERVVVLDEPQSLVAQMSDGSPVDGPALRRALAGPAIDAPVEAYLTGVMDLADLDLWLTVTSIDLARLTILAAPGDWLRLGSLLPIGALIGDANDQDRLGVAMVLPSELAAGGPAGLRGHLGRFLPAAVVSGFGPTGPDIASRVAERATRWGSLRRPGAREMRLTVRPVAVGPEQVSAAEPSTAPRDAKPLAPEARMTESGTVLLRRPSVTIEVDWLA